MVVFNVHKQKENGSGIIDSLLKPFTAKPRYEGERHAISLAPATFGQSMNFMGPHTRLDLRLNPDGTPKANSIPISKSDFESYKHDLAYDQAKKNYEANPTSENRKKQLKKVWNADETFINEMNHDTTEPMAPIAGKLIQTKRYLERDLKILPTKIFDGFGRKRRKANRSNG